MSAVALPIMDKDYLKIISQIRLTSIEESKMQKIRKAQDFCQELSDKDISYSWCIKHPEVLGCDESKKYYQRYHAYLGDDYSVCKHLFLQERKGQKRKFLVIVDDEKSVDLKDLKEKIGSSKLEFAPKEELCKSLNTIPGNVSLFHIQFDKEKKVELILDQELFEKQLLAFHPLYNGMSLFLTPASATKYLDTIDRTATIMDIPSKEKEYMLVKSL